MARRDASKSAGEEDIEAEGNLLEAGLDFFGLTARGVVWERRAANVG